MDDSLYLNIGAASDPGLVRRENEDALGYQTPGDPHLRRTRGALFVVCDGIGGMRGGRYASHLAVDSFLEAYYAGEAAEPAVLLRRAAARANDKVYLSSQGQGRAIRMGTTIVAAVVRGGDLWVLNIGDSRAYLWRQGALRQLTQDHVPVDRRKSGDRRIARALGTDQRVQPYEHGPVPLAPGDQVLLCTDGLTTAVSEPAIAHTIGEFPAQQAVRQLIEQAKTAGAQDNVSVLLVGLPERAEPTQERRARVPNRFLGVLSGLGVELRKLRWTNLHPVRLITTQRWRTPGGALAVIAWLVLALAAGLLVGLLLVR